MDQQTPGEEPEGDSAHPHDLDAQGLEPRPVEEGGEELYEEVRVPAADVQRAKRRFARWLHGR